MDTEDYALIASNAERFGVRNLTPILGKAPEAWMGLAPPDAVFVGGTGAQGVQGPQGVTGSGAQGATGAQGPAGGTGPQGATGGAGAQGPHGAGGAAGGTGPQGATGGAGAQGPQGAAGPVGGTNTQVIYNDAGAPAGDGSFTFNKTTKALAAQVVVPGQIQASALGLGAQSGALTINWQSGMVQAIQVAGNLTLSFSNFDIYGPMLKLYFYNTQGGTITFPAAVVWPLGIVPNFAAGPRKEAIVAFLEWGGNAGGAWFANAAVY